MDNQPPRQQPQQPNVPPQQPITPPPHPISDVLPSTQPTAPQQPRPQSVPGVDAQQPTNPQPAQTPISEQLQTIVPARPEVSSERTFAGAFKGILSVIIFIALVVGAAALINRFIFQSYYVDGTSMVPTLANDDRLIINKVDKTVANLQGKTYIPKRGEIIVLDSSLVDQFQHNEELVKRVIGLPGDTITIKNGKVTIKNPQSPEGFDPDAQLGLNLDATHTEEELNLTVGKDQIFVLGDNRGAGQSYDSRAFGPVEASKIQGRLVLRIFPFNKVTSY